MKSAADDVSQNLNMENGKLNKNLLIEHAMQIDMDETRIQLATFRCSKFFGLGMFDFKGAVNHAAVQCELPFKKRSNVLKFDITDDDLRRGLVRRLYCVVMLQQLISMFFMEVSLICFGNAFPEELYLPILVLVVVIYALLYTFKNVRRPAPFNYMVLAVPTLINAGQDGIYATLAASQWALLGPFAVSIELVVLIAYMNCITCLKFTNSIGILLLLVLFATGNCMLFFVFHVTALSGLLRALCVGIYIVYDTQLMLTGYYGYNLKPHEHIYAATNLFSDFALLCWRLFRWLCLAHVIGVYRFLRSCCGAEVC